MLEVKNIRKEYKSKKGVVTKALDDVSLTFPEKGMVFILGKSGSGKSTLLNVCGGLDRMDSGEIIIKGKSSKSFSAQDFDSYRNTYVGFVFQEYNILDEFTVEENIALALELQNKKRDKNIIEKILADVEMTDFAKRKPNTLSGGQKQRVAIARALVKEPQIIMADEPTGALDSKTGKQVFDTLKKLSETKLVIVISHDRDFAEQYGDRIIELKDGKVISDQTRVAEGDGAKNVRFFGTDTITVNSGSALTDDDLLSIKNFLAKAGGAAVISTSRENITQMKEGRPEISVGAFENIKEQPQSKKYEQQKLIRSHLPLHHAFKMGASGLKTKPVRLMFTILLSVVAFVLFGLFSTLMLFDGRSVTVQTFVDSQINKVMLNKVYYETHDYGNGDINVETKDTEFTDDEFKAILNKYPGAIASVRIDQNIGNLTLSSTANSFYSSQVNSMVPATDSLKVLAGRLPSADDEVAITDFMVEMFKSSGSRFVYGDSRTALTVTDNDSVIYSESKPVTLEIGSRAYKIVGVFKGMNVIADYKSMKSAADNGTSKDNFGFGSYSWSEERDRGLYNAVAFTPELFDSFAQGGSFGGDYFEPSLYFKDSTYKAVLKYQIEPNNDYVRELNRFSKYVGVTLNVYGFDGAPKKSLDSGEVAISYNMARDVIRTALFNKDSLIREALNREYENEHPEPEEGAGDYWEKWNEWNNARNETTERTMLQLYNAVDDEDFSTLSETAIAERLSFVYGVLKKYDCQPKFTVSGNTTAEKTVDVYYFCFRGNASFADDCMYMSDDMFVDYYRKPQYSNGNSNTNYVPSEDAYINTIFIPFDGVNHTSARIEQLLDLASKRGADDSGVRISNGIKEQLDFVIEIASEMEKVFVIVGVVFAVFAFLMMFNFISASITAKKKEIGILRAIGARTLDVFKIFLSEAFIIALICFAISAGGSFGLCIFLNSMLASDAGLSASLFVFGPISLLIVFGIAFVTAFISTILPVALYSRKPPIASIKSL